MRWNRVLMMGSMVLLGSSSLLRAEDPVWEPIDPEFRLTAALQAQPAQPAQPAPDPAPDLFAQAEAQGPSGSSNPGSGHPQMIGDLNGGIFLRRIMTFPTTVRVRVTTTTTGQVPVTQIVTRPSIIRREVNVPLAARGPFKISENESPVPATRAYTTYNYFNNVAVLGGRTSVPPLVSQINSGRLNPAQTLQQEQAAVFSQPDPFSTSLGSEPVLISPAIPGIRSATTLQVLGFDPPPALKRLDVHREVFGFEQAMMDNTFSVGVRLPLIQQIGDSSLDGSHIGDVDVIFKYALLNDEESGDVLSAGLMVTAPTGESDLAVEGRKIHPALIQPFIGYFANFGDFYVQGFSSLIVPTDSRDATLFCNDVAVGYRLYRDESDSGLIRSISPVLEGHLTTPLDNRGAHDSPAGFPDIFVGTAGVHLGLGERASLTVGATTPLTGPQPYDAEGIVQFNFRF